MMFFLIAKLLASEVIQLFISIRINYFTHLINQVSEVFTTFVTEC